MSVESLFMQSFGIVICLMLIGCFVEKKIKAQQKLNKSCKAGRQSKQQSRL